MIKQADQEALAKKDIVHRLRDHPRAQYLSCSPASVALCNDAAVEIERLRALLGSRKQGLEEAAKCLLDASDDYRCKRGGLNDENDHRVVAARVRLDRAWETFRYALKSTPVSAPVDEASDGWPPHEPTDTQIEAGLNAADESLTDTDYFAAIYKAMLAAAPNSTGRTGE